MEKIKVVWICHVQNPMLREKIPVGVSRIEHLVRKIIHKPEITFCPDVAQWITNGAKEMENFSDQVELYIVSPGYALKNKYLEFTDNGINYCLYRNEDYEFGTIIKNKLFHTQYDSQYKKNRKRILHYIKRINPDIVHLIGLENHFYTLSLNDIPTGIPTIAQLTALLNDSEFFTHFFMNRKEYEYRAGIEKKIINKADYIITSSKKFATIIYDDIKSNAKIINVSLPLTEAIDQSEARKEYDFVYFALNISKAVDLAIDAFVLASKMHPGITLNIVGGYPQDIKMKLDDIIKQNGLENMVKFEGKLPTHEDVIAQIRKSRFALLPLKIDLTSGTIREAMANGLPVITTDTGVTGTQMLNARLETALLSPIGDADALARNIIRMIEDDGVAQRLRNNAFEQHARRKSNKEVMKRTIEAYQICLENYHNGTPIPQSFITPRLD